LQQIVGAKNLRYPIRIKHGKGVFSVAGLRTFSNAGFFFKRVGELPAAEKK
jgi:hypothetical protein